MTGGWTALVPLTLVLYCGLRPSLADILPCTYSNSPEAHTFSVSPPSVCDYWWSIDKKNVATHVTQGPGVMKNNGVVKSNVTTVVTDRCKPKMEYEADCEDGWRYTAVCQTNCSVAGQDPRTDGRNSGADHTTIKIVVPVVLLLLGLAGWLIYKVRNPKPKAAESNDII
ncbi:hypothetical protein JOB18_000316 [Solea senegalensis]|uniref:Uncharacterized protein n=1 Tax=Solea senegalensis TaxID=28829 RepID=A0AAV6PNN4_SOLSE|nr:hypothetical protein JOB18_000316 [Solea senegalensis]